jgi:hypothetical protein
LKNKSLLIIEPVSIHWSYVYPLADHFLNNGWAVTFSGKKDLQHSVTFRINDNKNISNLKFKEHSLTNICKMLFSKWDAISLAPRVFFSKRKTYRLGCINDFVRQILYLFLLTTFKKTTILMIEVHQINTLTQIPKTVPLLNILNNILFYWFQRRMDLINVMDSTVKTTIKSKGIQVPVFVSPFFIFKNQPVVENNLEILKIVLPGRIDIVKKDYSWIELIPDVYQKKMVFIFAGRAMSDVDRDYIVSLKKKGVPTHNETNGDYVSEEVFDELCAQSDIMIGPFKNSFIDGEGSSIIGVHTSTGCVNDALRYGKPLLLPKGLQVGEQCLQTVHHYEDNNNLCQLLIQLSEKTDMYNKMKIKALENSNRFIREKVNYLEVLILLRYDKNLETY